MLLSVSSYGMIIFLLVAGFFWVGGIGPLTISSLIFLWYILSNAHMLQAKLLQLCLILCNPMDTSRPGSSVHGSPGRTIGVGCNALSPGDLSDPEIKPRSLMFPALAGRFFTTSATWETMLTALQTLLNL